MSSQETVFDPKAMAERRQAYFAFVRQHGPLIFKPDGSYQPTTEPDGRIPYWALPAFLADDATDEERELGLKAYNKGAGWDGFDIFMTSCIAANYVRHSDDLPTELKQRSEDHLARFTITDNGRSASAGVFDYMFHGYNDNMPSMATRTMVLAGDILDRDDLRDAGRFYLEGLCAHLQRRGMLSEYTSGTYTPISLCAILDIAECAQADDIREMAAACANRIILDLIGHWHWDTGSSGGTMSRAYTTDITETLSNLNAYMWYVSGHPLTIDPRAALRDDSFPGPMHHHRNRPFGMAQFVELMNASHETVSDGVRAFARQPKSYPYEIRATTDWAESGGMGGSVGYQSRSWQQPQYWLATSSDTGTGVMAGQHLLFHGALAATPKPTSWTDRVAFWHRLIADDPDQGEQVEASWSSAGPHKGAFAENAPDTVVRAESDNVHDVGRYVTAQKNGSALVVGSLSPNLIDEKVRYLRYNVFFGTFLNKPDEIFEDDQPLDSWAGTARPGSSQFLRFGDVYVGVRLTGMIDQNRAVVTREDRNRYLRIELRLIDHQETTITSDLHARTDFGCVFEIAAKDDVDSFADFRRQTMATTLEYYHSFYRNVRYIGRHGELQINDSTTRNTARFIAVDGRVEEPTRFAATGLDPELVKLFPDGRRVVQRRICYRPDYVASPYYDRFWQVLEADLPGPNNAKDF